MTAIRATRHLSGAALLAAGTLLSACDVAGSNAATWEARHSVNPRIIEEGVLPDGRAFRIFDNADGSYTMEAAEAHVGMNWTYDEPGDARTGTPAPYAPYVTEVEPGSPAAAAGFAPGDTIVSVDGRDARYGWPFLHAAPGTEFTLRVRRNGVERDARLTLGDWQWPDLPDPAML